MYEKVFSQTTNIFLQAKENENTTIEVGENRSVRSELNALLPEEVNKI